MRDRSETAQKMHQAQRGPEQHSTNSTEPNAENSNADYCSSSGRSLQLIGDV
jgi:hypothetical protein